MQTPYKCKPCTEEYCCPICKTKPSIKRYRSDRLKSVKPEMGAVEAAVGVELEPNSKSNPYYDCAGCKNEYEDMSGVSITNITQRMVLKDNVMKSIAFYYGEKLRELNIGLKDLILNYRTGIIAGKRNILSKAWNKLKRNQYKIRVCICLDEFRSYISLQRKRDKTGYIYYEALSLGVP